MAEYDLGTAHGKIKITSDSRGAAQAKRDIDALKSESAALSAAMEKAAKSSDRLSGSTDRLGGSSSRADGNLRRLANTLSSVAAAGVGLAGINLTMSGLATTSKKAFEGFQQFQRLQSTFTTFSGAIAGAKRSLTGYNQAVSQLTGQAKAVVTLSAALQTAAGAWSAMSAAGAWAGAKISRVSRTIRNSWLSEKMVYPLHYAQRALTAVGLAASGIFATGMASVKGSFLKFGMWATVAATQGTGLTKVLGSVGLAGFNMADKIQGGVSRMAATVAQKFGASATAASNFGKKIAAMTPGIIKTVSGISGMVIGAKMMANGFNGLVKGAAAFSLVVGGLHLGSIALKAIGTAGLGAWNAIKQLSGVALILPGALFSAGLAGGVLVAAVKGIGEAFSVAKLEGDDYWKALEKLSPFMREVAKSAKEFAKDFRGLKDIATETVFHNLAQDIKALGQNYMPVLQTGIERTARGLNAVKSAFVGFANDRKTVSDFAEAFSLTGRIMTSFSRSVKPVMSGLRDIGMVGIESTLGLAMSMEALTGRFEKFASKARANGSLKRWLDEGIQGTKDFGKILNSTGDIIGATFRAVGGNGENALSRSRKAMEGFAKAAQKSSQSGGLRAFGDSVSRMSDRGLKGIRSAIGEIGEISRAFSPFMKEMSSAFTETLASKIRMVGNALEYVGKAVSMIPGGGSFVGSLLGMALAAKTAQIALTGLKSAATFLAGGMLFMKSASTAATGAATAMMGYAGASRKAGDAALRNMAPHAAMAARMQTTAASAEKASGVMGKAGQGFSKASGAMKGALSAIGGPLTIGIAGAVAAGMIWSDTSREISNHQANLKKTADDAARATRNMASAFQESNGTIDSGVKESVNKEIESVMGNMMDGASNWTGFWNDVGAATGQLFAESLLRPLSELFTLGEADFKPDFIGDNQKIDDYSAKLQGAIGAMKKFGYEGESLQAVVMSNGSAWRKFVSDMSSQGEGGDWAIEQVGNLRRNVENLKASYDRMGESTQIANAFKVLGDAASTTADKLNAVKSALQGLGILQTDATTAAFSMAKAIESAGEAMEANFDSNGDFGAALFNQERTNWNTDSKNASAYASVLQTLGDELMVTAASGGDVALAYSKMEGQLAGFAAQAGVAGPEYAGLVSQLERAAGIAVPELQIMVSVMGDGEAQAQLAAVALQVRNTPQQSVFRLNVESDEAFAAIQATGAEITRIGDGSEVEINVSDAQARQNLMSLLAMLQDPRFRNANINVAAEISKPMAGINTIIAGLTAANGAAASPIPIALSGVDVATAQIGSLSASFFGLQETPPVVNAEPGPGLTTVQGMIDNIKAGGEQINSTPIAPPVSDIAGIFPTPEAPPAPVVLPPPVYTPPPPPPPIQIPMEVTGAEAANAAIQGVSNAASVIVPPPPIHVQVTGGEEAASSLRTAAEGAQGAVASFQAFATGVGESMASAASAAQTGAATASGAIQGAANGAHGSGSALGSGFADGIRSQVGNVAAAAAELAAAASASLPNSPAKIGPFSGRGWTPFRGAALAEGFAQGIAAGSPQAQAEALAMANQVAQAMNQAYAGFNMPVFSATAKYMKQTSKTNDQLKQDNLKRIEEREKEEARSALREEQNKAKDEKKEASKNEARGIKPEAKDETPKTPEQIQQDRWAEEDKAEQDRYDAAIKLLEDGNGTQEQINSAIGEVASNTEAKDTETADALRVLANQDSGDLETLAALEAIDRSIASQEDIETQDVLKGLKDSSMSRRGMEEMRPVEASTDLFSDSVKVAEGIFKLLDGFEKAVKDAGELADLAIRGFSNTKDVTTAIDGVQSVFSAASGLAEGVMSVVSTVSSIAMAFGTLIPGVGAAAAAIGGFGSAVNTVNGIVDLVQQGMSIAGRIFGTGMAMLAGGKDGIMYGKISTLIDTNDKTIKRWSDANVDDKRSTSYGKVNQNTTNNGVETLNIYQSPGVDPYRMVDEAMFAIKAEGVGVYG